MNRVDERQLALYLELGLLVALLALLGVAAVKLFSMLDRIGIPWVKGLPLAALFVAAGWLTLGRIRRVRHRLRSARNLDE